MATLNFNVSRPAPTMVERAAVPISAALLPSVSPTATTPLTMGEWLLRGTGGADSLSRPGAGAQATVPTFPYYTWTGDTSVQVTNKGTILIPPYEAWTMLWDELAPPATYGDALAVQVTAMHPTWPNYGVLCLQAGGGFTIGFALNPIPTAAGTRLFFRANY